MYIMHPALRKGPLFYKKHPPISFPAYGPVLSSTFYWHIHLKPTAYFFDPPCISEDLPNLLYMLPMQWLGSLRQRIATPTNATRGEPTVSNMHRIFGDTWEILRNTCIWMECALTMLCSGCLELTAENCRDSVTVFRSRLNAFLFSRSFSLPSSH